jgi:MFS family permease
MVVNVDWQETLLFLAQLPDAKPGGWEMAMFFILALLGGLLGAIFGGLRSLGVSLIETHTSPNQDIRLALRNAAMAGITSGLVLGTAFGLHVWQSGWSGVTLAGLSLGLLAMAIAGLWFGGVDVLKHWRTVHRGFHGAGKSGCSGFFVQEPHRRRSRAAGEINRLETCSVCSYGDRNSSSHTGQRHCRNQPASPVKLLEYQ